MAILHMAVVLLAAFSCLYVVTTAQHVCTTVGQHVIYTLTFNRTCSSFTQPLVCGCNHCRSARILCPAYHCRSAHIPILLTTLGQHIFSPFSIVVNTYSHPSNHCRSAHILTLIFTVGQHFSFSLLTTAGQHIFPPF
jgi:hypothetical protein